MLIEFSVKNFLSFKDKVTLSLEKGNGDENINNVFKKNNIELLKTCSIYGANASGKSNLLKAFVSSILMIRNSNIVPVGWKWDFIKPFLFDEKTKFEPTEFEYIFIANNIKYRYCFKTTSEKIIDESLEAYYSKKPTIIYTRKKTNEYKFLITDENKLKSIETKNTDNKLFLATATNWNYDKTKDAYLWFMESIDVYDTLDIISKEDLKDLSKGEESLKNFTLNLLKESDIIIDDFNVDYEEKNVDINFNDIYSPSQKSNKITNVKIETIHEFVDKNNKKNIYKLDMKDESSGTKILFSLAPLLKRIFETPKVVIIDELEKSLHPRLVEYLIKIFNNPKINKANSQLIFTTHAINLLNLNLFRRDQIWFVEKNSINGSTDLYPLDSFSVRKEENIQKGYINGRYGAIPFINDMNLWVDSIK